MNKIKWKTAKQYEDITYKKYNGVARIAFNRPEVRNAFRPKTTSELLDAFKDAHEDTSIGVVLLKTEFGRFVVVEIKNHVENKDMLVKMVIIGSIFWKFND